MFGNRKVDAQAVVVLREQTGETKRNINGINMVTATTYRYVLEVQPATGSPWRAPTEHKFKNYELARPDVGDTVPVRYAEKHPEDVAFHLEGDPRWDHELREKAAKEQSRQLRAALADRGDDAFAAALAATPGTPGVKDTEQDRFRATVFAALEAKRASGELSEVEYEAKKRELEASLKQL